MPCFFCNSVEHLTIYCNIYASDVERKKVAELKKCCPNCLIENRKIMEFGHKRKFRGIVCNNLKCFICFSVKHSTVFCPDRLHTVQIQIVPPKFDNLLFHRFLKMLDSIELLNLLLYLSPTQIHLFDFKQIEVIDKMDISKLFQSVNSNVVVNNELYLEGHGHESYKKPAYLNPLQLKNIIFKPKKILINSSKFFTEDFFQFLGPSTKELFCTDLELTTDAKFGELLGKIPTVKNIYLRKTNIDFGDSWPQILINSDCKKLEEIDFVNESSNFDIEILSTLMKQQKIRVNLTIESNESTYMDRKKGKLLNENLLKHFKVVENEFFSKFSVLKIRYHKIFDPLEPKK